MLYLELLKETLSVIFITIFVTLAIYILIFWLLRRYNKYNVRNFWFILCSIPFIPFMFFELSFYMASVKVENNIVEPARSYACSIAQTVDSYNTVVSDAVVGTLNNFISENSSKVQEKVVEGSKNVVGDINNTIKTTSVNFIDSCTIDDSLGINQDALVETVENIIDSVSNNAINVATSIEEDVINQATTLVTESATNVVSETVQLLPQNIVAELKIKFPALALFLTDNGIDGDTSEEIVDSIFGKVKDAIKSFRIQRVLSLLKFAFVFIGLSLFFGWRKQKCKAKKRLMSEQ